MGKTIKYSKSAIFVWYKNGHLWLSGVTERASLKLLKTRDKCMTRQVEWLRYMFDIFFSNLCYNPFFMVLANTSTTWLYCLLLPKVNLKTFKSWTVERNLEVWPLMVLTLSKHIFGMRLTLFNPISIILTFIQNPINIYINLGEGFFCLFASFQSPLLPSHPVSPKFFSWYQKGSFCLFVFWLRGKIDLQRALLLHQLPYSW